MEVWNGISKKILVWNGIWDGRFLVWNGNGMEENCLYGIRKNRLPFHIMPCPGGWYSQTMSEYLSLKYLLMSKNTVTLS